MRAVYTLRDGGLSRNEHDDLAGAVWIDLCDPTADEEAEAEALIGIPIPKRTEMSDIEESARLYEQRGGSVMTVVVAAGISEGRPHRTQVTFILTRDRLVTVRYSDPGPFVSARAACERKRGEITSTETLLGALIGALIAGTAETIEEIGTNLAGISQALFVNGDSKRSSKRTEGQLQVIMRKLGRRNMAVAILRESLLSIERLIPYLRQRLPDQAQRPFGLRLKQLERDVRSLSTHETQLSLEISYLHDATLGLINLEQTRVIKAFSIAAVLFLPATLVGTVYGMNFKSMPELEWSYGYPFALGVMVASAVIPYVWLRRSGWL